ncbi:bifunctional nuclease family protein [Natronocalculus amylovorans]|uniref:Bifunctional nuclease family protein n=1 Tax=Natronocalculus amylovorans TaxID=2917812 RepID=A0AAE3FXA3_9EURY|nr:bifunctional nuclease family protein [Natronocalculus amylovorans]MCL9816906.1 bifunctional nuclease family protein [Natronocalculus amylovorans]NUE03033.1 bifunctional nuclease family protein [Halorubraceae archaeon YAN]
MEHTAEIEGIGMGVGPDGASIPAVILAAREEYVPIFITDDQAQSIQLAIESHTFERPLTHDLLVEMVTELGGAIDSVRIDDLADGTFYAKIRAERYVSGEPEPFTFDARPSDAIAIAVRLECPIIVSDAVLDAAGRPPSTIDVADSGVSEQALDTRDDSDHESEDR